MKTYTVMNGDGGVVSEGLTIDAAGQTERRR